MISFINFGASGNSMRFAYLARWVCVGSLLCVSAGCSSKPDWQARTYPAHGTALINGQIPADLFVMLNPLGEPFDSRKANPWGVVTADGRYVITTYEDGDGAPPGEYMVTLRWPFDVAAPGDRLGYAFSKVENSPMTVVVKAGDNEFPPIELTGVKVKKIEK